MARILVSEGAKVDLLVLLDSTLPTPRDHLRFADKVHVHVQRFRQKGVMYIFEWARNQYLWRRRQLRDWLGRNGRKRSDPDRFRSEVIFCATEEAMRLYELTRYEGRTVLFRPPLEKTYTFRGGRVVNANREFVYEDNGWSDWTPNLSVHEIASVPGDHDGFVLEPYVRDLASQLRACIAQSSTSGS